MAKTDDSETLSENLGLRVAARDIERLDLLAEKFPVVSRHAIARVAMRIGLEMIEKDPSRLLTASANAKSRKRRR